MIYRCELFITVAGVVSPVLSPPVNDLLKLLSFLTSAVFSWRFIWFAQLLAPCYLCSSWNVLNICIFGAECPLMSIDYYCCTRSICCCCCYWRCYYWLPLTPPASSLRNSVSALVRGCPV